MITLEVTAHRFGGEDGYPREFRRDYAIIQEEGRNSIELTSTTNAALYLQLVISDPVHIDPEWIACIAQLDDVNGYTIGRRPALIFNQPYDIPTHTNFGRRHPDAGRFILGLRKLESK